MEYGRHVARRRRRRLRSIPLAMLTMKKSCMVSISMHACGSVPIVMMLRLAALQDAGRSSACTIRADKNKHKLTDSEQKGSAKD